MSKELILQPKVTLDSLFEKAVNYQVSKQFEKALNVYFDILKSNSGVSEIYCNIATIYKEIKEYNNSIEYYNKAINLNPEFTDAWYNLGIVFNIISEYNNAIVAYSKALKLSPSDLRIKVNLANSYYNINDYKQAKNYYKDVIIVNTAHINANINLANIYQLEKNYTKALDLYSKVYKLEPNNISNLSMYYYCLRQICAWDNIEELGVKLNKLIDDSLENKPYIKITEPPFANIARTDNIKQNYLVAKNNSKFLNVLSPGFNKTEKKDKNHKIKIAYLSSDFYDHATMHLLRGLFSNHDKDKFEINIFSYGKTDDSIYFKELLDNINNFYDITKKSNQEAAKLINSKNIDILIDLKGFTKEHRLGILAFKPAPIQITYLGYPGTTGADFVDYVITDEIVTPKSEQKYYSENFLYLNCYQANDELSDININTTRKEHALPDGEIVFCCFNQGFKIDLIIFQSWMRILKQVPNSILWLFKDNNEMVGNIKEAAKKFDIDIKRIIFADKLSKDMHLARLQLADIMLDTRIYTGHTTTSDAIRAGLPVVTMLGKSFSGRVSASLLNAINMQELIAIDIDNYIELAVKLATSKTELAEIKYKIQKNMKNSKLFKPKLLALELENMYIQVYKSSQ